MDHDSARFLSAFNAIETYLRDLIEADASRSFSELVHQASHDHALVRRLSAELRHLADLRNFLVHRFQEAEPLAVPSGLSMQKVERIRDALLQPQLLHSLFHKVVVCCRPEDSVGAAAQKMHEHDFSQLPVYDGKQSVGLLTTDTVARWLSSRLASGVGLVEEESVRDVLACQQYEQTQEFASHRATVTDAFGWWEKHFHRGRPLQAILLTPHGRPSEMPTGIVTLGDFPAMLEAVGL
ncbi:MAG: CBS domain-containing protein [Pirellulaceae bacterium]